MRDTMVEAIALSSPSGRMSARAHKAALKRLANTLFAEYRKPEATMGIREIAGEARKALNPTLDQFNIGQEVIARFTNCGYIREFRGRIVGRTKNYWKVESIVSPYENESPGRVFHIATLEARNYSANNCIREVSNA